MKPQLSPYVGERLAGEPKTPAGHLYTCKACGQAVDKRDLAAVFHHEEPSHQPLANDDAERLRRIDEQLATIVSEQTQARPG
jgi:hypothetical protein